VRQQGRSKIEDLRKATRPGQQCQGGRKTQFPRRHDTANNKARAMPGREKDRMTSTARQHEQHQRPRKGNKTRVAMPGRAQDRKTSAVRQREQHQRPQKDNKARAARPGRAQDQKALAARQREQHHRPWKGNRVSAPSYSHQGEHLGRPSQNYDMGSHPHRNKTQDKTHAARRREDKKTRYTGPYFRLQVSQWCVERDGGQEAQVEDKQKH
jgi:hypothetical protein